MVDMNFDLNLLKNKNILITGASNGIGKSLSENLSKYGANVIMLSRNENALDAIYDSLKKKISNKSLYFKM